MIKSFNEAQVRTSGVIYNGSWEQIKMLYEQDPQLAGELAISLFELTLTGQVSTDNFTIKLLLKNQEKIVEKDKREYERKAAGKEAKKIERLTTIAELYKEGYKQKDIAEMLGKAPSTISEDLSTIRTNYPELLQGKFGKFENFGSVNDNVNDNVNVNDNDNDNFNDNQFAGQERRREDFTSGAELQDFKARGGIVI